MRIKMISTMLALAAAAIVGTVHQDLGQASVSAAAATSAANHVIGKINPDDTPWG